MSTPNDSQLDLFSQGSPDPVPLQVAHQFDFPIDLVTGRAMLASTN